MALPRMKPESTALLVIDVQERLMPTIAAAARVEANCAILARAATVLGMPVICTEQYVKGLGHTVPTVRDALPSTAHVVEKTRFSALVDGVRAALRTHRTPNVLVCGVEAHVCVLQTVLDLLALGYEVHVPHDAVASRSQGNHERALDRLTASGAVISSTESVLFEWCGVAGTPEFRQISQLVK